MTKNKAGYFTFGLYDGTYQLLMPSKDSDAYSLVGTYDSLDELHMAAMHQGQHE